MRRTISRNWLSAAWVLIGLGAGGAALGNGGPFVVKYPGGDPAAKGILARLDPGLKPTRESRLRVEKEDLTIEFGRDDFSSRLSTPLAHVSAVYTIANPSDAEVSVDFGFPILRGIYMSPFSMMPRPDVQVTVDGKGQAVSVISNSLIYGIIRRDARGVIERAIAQDEKLAELVAAVRRPAAGRPTPSAGPPAQQSVQRGPASAPTAGRERARQALASYLAADLKWNPRDAALLVEYAGLDLGPQKVYPFDRWHHPYDLRNDKEAAELLSANLGVLAAIGEQKATQFLAQIAARFDRAAVGAYEDVFAAWGGEVRERAVDLVSGEIRPREFSAAGKPSDDTMVARRVAGDVDPTVYARVDYLDPNAKLTEAQRASCQAVLKNLPVVFTFAPMNLLHYRVSFPPRAKRVVAVSYRQFAYSDTRDPASYQLAYVLHTASFWDDFGPIHLTVRAPSGIVCRASVPMRKAGQAPARATGPAPKGVGSGMVGLYQADLTDSRDKTGELFVAVDQAAWSERLGAKGPSVAAGPQPIGTPPPSPPR